MSAGVVTPDHSAGPETPAGGRGSASCTGGGETPLEVYEPVAEIDDHYDQGQLEIHLHDGALSPCGASTH